MNDNTCGAPHPAYGDGDVCRLLAGHDGPHHGSTMTETWDDASIRQFQANHSWAIANLSFPLEADAQRGDAMLTRADWATVTDVVAQLRLIIATAPASSIAAVERRALVAQLNRLDAVQVNIVELVGE